jgi:hypothetical protein
MDGWMDGFMHYTGLTRLSIQRKAQYEAKAGGMSHDYSYTSHCTLRACVCSHNTGVGLEGT